MCVFMKVVIFLAMKNHIKARRLEKNVLQAQLADAIKCDKRTISRYETGDRAPSLEIAFRMADFLDINVDELFELDDN